MELNAIEIALLYALRDETKRDEIIALLTVEKPVSE